jgi:hypothetical protein
VHYFTFVLVKSSPLQRKERGTKVGWAFDFNSNLEHDLNSNLSPNFDFYPKIKWNDTCQSINNHHNKNMCHVLIGQTLWHVFFLWFDNLKNYLKLFSNSHLMPHNKFSMALIVTCVISKLSNHIHIFCIFNENCVLKN